MAIYIPDEKGELTALDQATLATADATVFVPPGDLGATFGKMILTLVALVALLFLSYWFLRKLIQGRMERGVGDKAIQIIEKRMLSPKTLLYLVEVDKKRILIAESHLEVKRIESYDAVKETENPLP